VTERTLAIVKPGAVGRGYLADIIFGVTYDVRLTPLMIQRQEWSKELAAHFYLEHGDKPFFERLVAHAASGQCYAMLLEGEDAVQRWRVAMGPTDPRAGDKSRGDLRREFGTELPDNALHGSADVEAALREIDLMRYWFDWRL
jgi:nucleoside diphosphate kinase